MTKVKQGHRRGTTAGKPSFAFSSAAVVGCRPSAFVVYFTLTVEVTG